MENKLSGSYDCLGTIWGPLLDCEAGRGTQVEWGEYATPKHVIHFELKAIEKKHVKEKLSAFFNLPKNRT